MASLEGKECQRAYLWAGPILLPFLSALNCDAAISVSLQHRQGDASDSSSLNLALFEGG